MLSIFCDEDYVMFSYFHNLYTLRHSLKIFSMSEILYLDILICISSIQFFFTGNL